MPSNPAPASPLLLGTARWVTGDGMREVLVTPLPSDPRRLVDLNRVEAARLQRLGEGRTELLAEARVPASLLGVLASGPRCLPRLRTALAYAEKWQLRGDLPELLAPRLDQVARLACLPVPATLLRDGGEVLDSGGVRGPGAVLVGLPQPTFATIGGQGGWMGHCLALEDPQGVVLGGWLILEDGLRGRLELRSAGHRRSLPVEAWAGLDVPALAPGQVRLLPVPRLRPLPDLAPGGALQIRSAFETMQVTLGEDLLHPTLQ